MLAPGGDSGTGPPTRAILAGSAGCSPRCPPLSLSWSSTLWSRCYMFRLETRVHYIWLLPPAVLSCPTGPERQVWRRSTCRRSSGARDSLHLLGLLHASDIVVRAKQTCWPREQGTVQASTCGMRLSKPDCCHFPLPATTPGQLNPGLEQAALEKLLASQNQFRSTASAKLC